MSSVSALNSLLSSTSSSSSSATDLSSILAAVAGTSSPGIDVNGAVSAGVYAARSRERLWQAQQSTLASQTTALNTVQNAVTSLNNDMQSLNSIVGPLSARSVTSTNSAIVTGTAVSATAIENHVVVVDSIAQAAAWYSDVAGKSTDNLPKGSFTITPTTGSPITVKPGTDQMTLGDVVDYINLQASAQNLGLQARVVNDTTGSRLAIVSTASGAAKNFTVFTGDSYPTSTTSWTSGSVASENAKLVPGTFTLITSAGSASITVSSNDTVATLAKGVNDLNMGVTATVVTDGTNGTATLQITSSGSNSANKFSISRDPTTAGMGFTQSMIGADAQFSVDGIPSTSASNTVAAPAGISGLTLNLQGANPQSIVNISIAPNTDQVATAINQFVTDYNTAITLVNSQFTYSATNQGALSNDPTIRSLQSAMMRAIGYVVPSWGSPPTAPAIATLGSLGISMANDGTLSVDSTTLTSALQNNYSDVQRLFQGTALNGFANRMDQALNSFISPGDGAFTVDLQSISSLTADLQDHINDYEANVITPLQKQLQASYSKAEIALQGLSKTMQQLNAELGLTNNSSGG